MVLVFLNMFIMQYIKVIGQIICLMVRVLTPGAIIEFIQENGERVKCMEPAK